MPVYNKLVRDRIPEIIAEEGKATETRILDEIEYRRALADKALEEAGELSDACQMGNVKEIAKEAADVLETVEAILTAYGIDPAEVARVKAERREKRGGFKKRIFLIRADD
jgi:predicted house-cleaning noncanonical NTP pyrophosphatase (MazG superfamily)